MQHYQKKILARFMSVDDLKEFEEQYKDNRYISRTAKKPSEKDVKIATAFHASKSASEVAKKFGLAGSYQVISAVGRVYAHKK